MEHIVEVDKEEQKHGFTASESPEYRQSVPLPGGFRRYRCETRSTPQDYRHIENRSAGCSGQALALTKNARHDSDSSVPPRNMSIVAKRLHLPAIYHLDNCTGQHDYHKSAMTNLPRERSKLLRPWDFAELMKAL